jgi:hypothetical protein
MKFKKKLAKETLGSNMIYKLLILNNLGTTYSMETVIKSYKQKTHSQV